MADFGIILVLGNDCVEICPFLHLDCCNGDSVGKGLLTVEPGRHFCQCQAFGCDECKIHCSKKDGGKDCLYDVVLPVDCLDANGFEVWDLTHVLENFWVDQDCLHSTTPEASVQDNTQLQKRSHCSLLQHPGGYEMTSGSQRAQ